MKFEQQINRIKDKLNRLKEADQDFEIFGSDTHEYNLNPAKTEEELMKFETENQITLPDEYREFLLFVGNGGAGPYYGLEPLEHGREVDLDYVSGKYLLDLSKPFQFTEPWNVEFEEADDDNYEEIEQQKIENYYDNKFSNGLLRISNFGCGVRMNIVVNGKEKGNIWVDDRTNGNGIFPDPYFDITDKITFLDWYELWLDKSLKEKNIS
ncbi:SMI1/KNR4 family protein [Nubsella zeaxanthinifaciens]|uniref:SMI1/KNR4 family protein n=1 Tax=Nubsella zeaxanthinifaciens TaxID=392412 RepID=UPI003D00FF96